MTSALVRYGLVCTTAVLLLFSSVTAQTHAVDCQGTLRSYADAAHFWVGTTIQRKYWQDPGYREALEDQFNSAVSIIMMRLTQPEPGSFDFGGMDKDISFAHDHNMKLFGAALVYRAETTPPWLGFNRPNCGGWSAAKLDGILRDRIHTLVQHGGDTFYGWEVVNEPLNPSHNGCWSKVLGEEEYISKAFRYAREANPNVLLVLNETFGHEGVDRGKADDFFSLIRRLKSKGVPIDVAGIEMHLHANVLRPTYVDEFKSFLRSARDARVQVQITEADVYQGPPGSTPNVFERQREIFYNIARECLRDPNCTALTTWGLGDKQTQLRTVEDPSRHFPDAAPLMFDDSYQKKPAFCGVLQAVREGR